MASSKQILSLYRQLLQKSNKFENYNFREWSKRKVYSDFKAHKGLTNKEEINSFYKKGLVSLAQLDRQTTISQMFTFEKLVVEPLSRHH